MVLVCSYKVSMLKWSAHQPQCSERNPAIFFGHHAPPYHDNDGEDDLQTSRAIFGHTMAFQDVRLQCPKIPVNKPNVALSHDAVTSMGKVVC